MAIININEAKVYTISIKLNVNSVVSQIHNVDSTECINEYTGSRLIVRSTYYSSPHIENILNIKKFKDSILFPTESDSPISLQTNHEKLLKFLGSMKNLDKLLESKRNDAQIELDSYMLDYYDNDFIKWESDSDLTNIKNGQRRFVGGVATGFFSDKRNQFGVYIGPSK